MVSTQQTASKSDTPVKSYGLRKFQQHTEGLANVPSTFAEPTILFPTSQAKLHCRAKTLAQSSFMHNRAKSLARCHLPPCLLRPKLLGRGSLSCRPKVLGWRHTSHEAPPTQDFGSESNSSTDPKSWVGDSFHHRTIVLVRSPMLACLLFWPSSFSLNVPPSTKPRIQGEPTFWFGPNLGSVGIPSRIRPNTKTTNYASNNNQNKRSSSSPTKTQTLVHPQIINQVQNHVFSHQFSTIMRAYVTSHLLLHQTINNQLQIAQIT